MGAGEIITQWLYNSVCQSMVASFVCSQIISYNQDFRCNGNTNFISLLKGDHLLLYFDLNENISNHYDIQPRHNYARTPTHHIL